MMRHAEEAVVGLITGLDALAVVNRDGVGRRVAPCYWTVWPGRMALTGILTGGTCARGCRVDRESSTSRAPGDGPTIG